MSRSLLLNIVVVVVVLTGNLSATDPSRPVLPEQFHAVVEWNDAGNKKTVLMEEWYDEHRKKATLATLDDGFQFDRLLDFNTREIFEITDGLCAVVNMSDSHDAGIFGKGGEMLSPSGVLRFGGDLSETYLGAGVVRSIPCHIWEHSGAAPELNIDKLNIVWYFSDPEKWTAAIGASSVPVRAVWTGEKVGEIGIRSPISYSYDYVQWEPGVTGDRGAFQTPPGIFCPNRMNTKPMPTLPDQFVVTIEEVKADRMIKRATRFWYDKNRLLARYDHLPTLAFDDEDQVTDFENRPLREIHDFHTGLAYVIDRERGNCSLRGLENSIDVRPPIPGNDDPIPEMKNPMEIFHYENSKFYYVGKRILRDMEVDVWMGQPIENSDPDGPPLPPDVMKQTYEWSFLSDDWREVDGTALSTHVPVQMRIFSEKYGALPVSTINFVDFDGRQMSVLEFDIKSCFRSFLQKKHFRFSIAVGDGYILRDVDDNIRIFEAALIESLGVVTDVRPMRISNIFVDDDDDFIYVMFDFTEAPLPSTGGIGEPTYPDIPLKEATARLEKSVAEGTFNIKFDADGKSVFVQAVPGSLVETFRPGSEKPTVSPVGTTTPRPMTPDAVTTTAMKKTTAAPVGKEPTGSNLTVGALIAIVVVLPMIVAGLTVALIFVIIRKYSTWPT